jgi:hypothetical protein
MRERHIGMSLHSYLLFVGASILLVLAPGPDMAYLLGRSIAQGKRAGVLATFGVNAGAYVHLVAAVTGLSAVLIASAAAFTAIKWIGALYLVWLGVRALRAPSDTGPLPAITLRGAGSGAVRSSRDSGPAAGPALSAPTGNRGLFNPPSTPRKYNLTVAMSMRNLLNHTNQGPIIGNISSPLFGRSNQMAGTPNGEGFSEAANNRRLELQIRLAY